MRRLFNIYDNSLRSNNIQTVLSCREDIIGELEAINQYESHYYATDDPVARKTIEDIMNEEKVHVGQLFGLLFRLDPTAKTKFEEGFEEFGKDANN